MFKMERVQKIKSAVVLRGIKRKLYRFNDQYFYIFRLLKIILLDSYIYKGIKDTIFKRNA